MQIWESGLDLFFSPLPALGRTFWACGGSLPAVMFTEPMISGGEIYVAF